MQAPELNEEQFARFRELIYRLAGIRIPETKRVLITNRVRRRLRATGMNDFQTYLNWITSPQGHAEVPQFLDAITTNETYFDRDPYQYQWFEREFLPGVIEASRSRLRPRRLRIWSAACSTGEELYGIAIRIHENRPALAGWEISLVGTDLSGEALAAARAASYDARAVRLLSPERRERHFEPDSTSQRWTLRPEIRRMVTWKAHNLMRPLAERPFDCIFLKNVLIYFDPTSKQAVLRNLLPLLTPGGFLVAGPTEGVHTMLDSLEKRKPWLYQKPEGVHPAPRT